MSYVSTDFLWSLILDHWDTRERLQVRYQVLETCFFIRGGAVVIRTIGTVDVNLMLAVAGVAAVNKAAAVIFRNLKERARCWRKQVVSVEGLAGIECIYSRPQQLRCNSDCPVYLMNAGFNLKMAAVALSIPRRITADKFGHDGQIRGIQHVLQQGDEHR
jgi:hypothetical protein